MKQFISTTMPDKDGLLHICGSYYHYFVHVLRYKTGDTFTGGLPDGSKISLYIKNITQDTLVVQICSQKYAAESEPSCKISLFQSLPKGEKLDLIVRQATEVGVCKIYPFVSEHSLPRNIAEINKRLPRLQRIINAAREQSGSVVDTKIYPAATFGKILENWRGIQLAEPLSLGILLYEAAENTSGFHDLLSGDINHVAIAIGPEGGFSEKEAAAFIESGFKPIKIRGNILRTETAALYAEAIVKTLFMEREWTKTRMKN
ncbi:ribosomal RNA small subunit methyltransferase E [Spirochaetia bacterium]|nr:ribosomal RNA small subunit methyltransferase E [Spirochaetia bacterium]